MAKAQTFQAVCDRCYTCVIATGTKRDCERAATSHITQYDHNVSITVPLPVPVPETVVEYASAETAYGRTVPASFSIKVF
jgi:hypothetical protein